MLPALLALVLPDTVQVVSVNVPLIRLWMGALPGPSVVTCATTVLLRFRVPAFRMKSGAPLPSASREQACDGLYLLAGKRPHSYLASCASPRRWLRAVESPGRAGPSACRSAPTRRHRG